jgi:hypothetical protein
MRRLVLLIAALLFGCDDPSVQAKALDVLEHGAIQATVDCYFEDESVPTFPPFSGYGGEIDLHFKSQQLVDGSFYSQCDWTGSVVTVARFAFPELTGRGESARVTARHKPNNISAVGLSVCEAYDGQVRLRYEGAVRLDSNTFPIPLVTDPLLWSTDIDGRCTGRNLEAFGVE